MARRSSKIDASVRRSCKAVYTTFFADVLIQHQQDPDLRISSLKRLRLENLKSNILNSSKIQDFSYGSKKSFLKILDLGSWIRIQDFSPGSKKSFLRILDLGSWIRIQDFSPGSKKGVQKILDLGSWIRIQDFSPGSKKGFLKILDLGSWIRISSLTAVQT